jgi:hypothetical protein
MIRLFPKLRPGLSAALFAVAALAAGNAWAQEPVIESASSGLFTFSREERAVRVAAAFVARDGAVVPTRVRFLDQGGNLLKEVRGTLSDGFPVIAELTRDDVAGRGDLLVRVEVVHKLPGKRRATYPIVVSTQPIGPTGSGSFVLNWPGGTCGEEILPGTSAGPRIPPGTHVNCNPTALTDF